MQSESDAMGISWASRANTRPSGLAASKDELRGNGGSRKIRSYVPPRDGTGTGEDSARPSTTAAWESRPVARRLVRRHFRASGALSTNVHHVTPRESDSM